MRSIIIDDDAIARLLVSKLCVDFPDIDLLEEFENAIDAIKFLNDQEVDLIFLDIHMPGFSGFDFIKTLKNSPRIILITSDKNFALEAFEYPNVVDYLVKPITKERFAKAIAKIHNFTQISKEKAIAPVKDSNKELYVNIDRRLVKIDFTDINVIEAKGDYIRIKTNNISHVVHSTLKKLKKNFLLIRF
jgi:DNA-binding LytR/AlgR family response regulator